MGGSAPRVRTPFPALVCPPPDASGLIFHLYFRAHLPSHGGLDPCLSSPSRCVCFSAGTHCAPPPMCPTVRRPNPNPAAHHLSNIPQPVGLRLPSLAHASVVNRFSRRASPANGPVLARRRARSHVEDITAMTQSPTPVCDKEKQLAPVNTERLLASVAWRPFPLFYS